MMILFLIGSLVFQNGDTLFFMKESTYADTIILDVWFVDGRESFRVVRQAKTASDNMTYFIHTATYSETEPESLVSTRITFYNAEKKKLGEEKETGSRNISFELSNIYDSMLIVTTWGRDYGNPAVLVIKDGKKTQIIKEMDWLRIVSYQVSPNNRYILFHTRNPFHAILWDYIYFYDLETGNDWDYVFPTCLSCKKARIELEINDSGRSEVVHKNEHRIFSPEGVLEDIYLKLQ
jgi:hypothetical protein